MEYNDYRNNERIKPSKILTKYIKEIMKEYENSKVYNDNERIEERSKMIQFVLDGLGITINKNSDYNAVLNLYKFCKKRCDWDFDKIKKYTLDFKSLEESIYKRNIIEGGRRKSKESQIIFEYFINYLSLDNDLEAKKISEQVYEAVLDATKIYGFSIEDTLDTWKKIDDLPDETFSGAITGSNEYKKGNEIDGLKSKLFKYMIEMTGLTRYSSPLDVFRVFKYTNLDVERTIRFDANDKGAIEAIKQVLVDYNPYMKSAETEFTKSEEFTKLTDKEKKRRLNKFKKEAKAEFIKNWGENYGTDGPSVKSVKIGEHLFVPLEAILDLGPNFNPKKIKGAIIIENAESQGFGSDLDSFIKFCEDISYYSNLNAIDKTSKRYFERVPGIKELSKRYNDTIYDLLSLYRNKQFNVPMLKDEFAREARNSKIKKIGARIAMVAASLMLAFGVGKFSSSKQPKKAIETTVEDDSTADSNGGQGGDSGEERVEDPISEEEKNRMEEFRDSMKPPQEGEIPSEEDYTAEPSEEDEIYEEYVEGEQDDGTAQYNEVSDEGINEEENDEYIEY